MTEQEIKDLERKITEEKRKLNKHKAEAKKKYIKDRDAFIQSVSCFFVENARVLKDFKQEAAKSAKKLHSDMYKVFDKEEKAVKSFTLENEEGTAKIIVEHCDRCNFNEMAEVHINAIKEVMRDKFAGRNKSLYRILESILVKNRKGDYDEKLVSKLNKHRDDVNDPRFAEALDELAKCYQVVGTSTYIKVYVRKDVEDKYETISLNFSAM